MTGNEGGQRVLGLVRVPLQEGKTYVRYAVFPRRHRSDSEEPE